MLAIAMLKGTKIAIIGLGKIGGALASSLVRNKIVSRHHLVGTTGHRDSALEAAKRYGIRTLTDNIQAIRDAQIIILAVKPQTMKKVLTEIKDAIREGSSRLRRRAPRASSKRLCKRRSRSCEPCPTRRALSMRG
jgi:ketol-acid reductoisomerase